MTRVFIDGREGTTGLRIRERLENRPDLTLIALPEALRKDAGARREALNACDVAFLCLPDAAAIEAVAMIENPDVIVLDTSTAHRTAPGWVYGFPELTAGQATLIASSKRIAVTGCHASGFIALIRPLIDAGVLPREALLTCHSLTGYSGGGRKMIAAYEADDRDGLLDAPRAYALTQQHKHLPEMKAYTELSTEPIFCPIVADYYAGMEVIVPLFAAQLTGGCDIETVRAAYAKAYPGPVVTYLSDDADAGGLLSAGAYAGFDDMAISVHGCDARMLLTARFDNLGKGASGAAVQCMNLALGLPMTAGLALHGGIEA